jgi:hypothetical protein
MVAGYSIYQDRIAATNNDNMMELCYAHNAFVPNRCSADIIMPILVLQGVNSNTYYTFCTLSHISLSCPFSASVVAHPGLKPQFLVQVHDYTPGHSYNVRLSSTASYVWIWSSTCSSSKPSKPTPHSLPLPISMTSFLTCLRVSMVPDSTVSSLHSRYGSQKKYDGGK